MLRLGLVALAVCAACSSSSSKNPDAPPMKMDGSGGSSAVQTVSCAGITPAATVTAMDGVLMYMPATTTISQGQVVLFMTTATHDVSPGHHVADSTISDPGIHVDFNMTGCRMFTQAGDYGFHCSIHNFDGTITVQ